RTGSGAGAMSSTPAGINCGSSCVTSFSSGTSVRLTALPNQGSTFAGWSGACSGNGLCQLTMNADQVIGATFTAVPDIHAINHISFMAQEIVSIDHYIE